MEQLSLFDIEQEITDEMVDEFRIEETETIDTYRDIEDYTDVSNVPLEITEPEEMPELEETPEPEEMPEPERAYTSIELGRTTEGKIRRGVIGIDGVEEIANMTLERMYNSYVMVTEVEETKEERKKRKAAESSRKYHEGMKNVSFRLTTEEKINLDYMASIADLGIKDFLMVAAYLTHISRFEWKYEEEGSYREMLRTQLESAKEYFKTL